MYQIAYRSGYKYQLAEHYLTYIDIKPLHDITTEFIALNTEGRLSIFSGYAWDGPSGPVRDRKRNMRPSLVHDALYQLMRMGLLDTRKYRKLADALYRDMLIENGVPKVRADIEYVALRKFGGKAASPKNVKKIYRAP